MIEIEVDESWAGSRLLLRQLRDLMKGRASDEQRLERIVGLIARQMTAEVCSLYLLRPGNVLELYATKGLKPEAVHLTRLRVGEGLVGDIAARARPLALADAQAHPNFAYRPETGEDIYRSLMGVPILRDGRVLGVIAVQNVQRRDYAAEEIEALETVAMVLAEGMAGSELAGPAESGPTLRPARLPAVPLTEGLGLGVAVMHQRGIVITRIVAEDPEQELDRLADSVAAMQASLESVLTRSELADPGEPREVLETFRLFARDRGWLNRIQDAIRSGLTAEAAVQKVQSDTRARMEQIVDPYLRERLVDLEDLGYGLLRHLLGDDGHAAAARLPPEAVLIARNLGPAELLDYDPTRLKAVVLAEGSPNAHVAIVARALELPTVGRCPEAFTRIWPGDFLVVDADNGQVLAHPGHAIRETFAESMMARDRRKQDLAVIRDLPAVSADGVEVSLNVNAGLLIDLPQVRDSGAEGIGLYRTEVPFMVRDAFPDVDAQTRLYRRVLEGTDGKPVVFRTLDVGGDKILPYWKGGAEENPAMGWRAVRITLDRPVLLRQQLRALIRASEGRPLQVMFPMVSEVAELDQCRSLLDLELELGRAEGRNPPDRVHVGIMIEVPALLWQLPAVFERVDFVSVGSNDLMQFLFAVDRSSPELARRYDVLSPPMLRLFKRLVAEADRAGKPISLCGEQAGQPLEAMALLSCGFRKLSMPPSSIPRVKNMLRSLKIGPLAAYIDFLAGQTCRSVRERLRHYARERGVVLE
ncbi:MAG: phosphoenolpyruvate--protein phosphotransferase [Rhodospirillales bacterium]|nr:phosphoenolpyruvate--protein phosphotransferase [Rhodospirillales bacterium]